MSNHCAVHLKLFFNFFKLKLYFIVYAITAVLIFPPWFPHSIRQFPHHCPCSWVMYIFSLATLFRKLYFDPWLFCNNQFLLLNPYTFFAHPPDSLPSGNHQNVLYDSVSVLLVHLFCVLDSIINRYIFIPFICSYFWCSFSERRPFNISYTNGLVMMNSFRFFLSGELFICSLILNDSFAE